MYNSVHLYILVGIDCIYLTFLVLKCTITDKQYYNLSKSFIQSPEILGLPKI